MDRPTFVYQLYIAATPEQVWEALTDPNLTVQYWTHRNISDWKVGSSWEHQKPDENHTVDISGEIIAYDPPKMTLTHENMEHEIEREVWAKVLSGLKTLLETGRPLSGLL
jgi:uncharacterized protein YndB with AHSA1/START domain